MFIRNLIERLKLWKCPQNLCLILASSKSVINEKDIEFQSNLQQFERYISFIKSVILWKNPIISVLCIVASNILLWLLWSIECRVFGALGLFLLGFTLRDVWTTHVWPEISVRPTPPPPSSSPSLSPFHPSMAEVGKLVEVCGSRACDKLALLFQLRQQQPALFCCVSLLLWFGLLLLGRSVSGPALLYISLMATLIGPGIYIYCLPNQLKTTVAAYTGCVYQAFTKYSDGSGDEDYLPVTTSEEQILFTRVSDMQQDAYDSITNPGSSSDMVSGLGLMPSHEEDSLASLSDLAVSLLPFDPPSRSHSPSPSDSGKAGQHIKFQSGHFNGDSSSDEEAFTRDLEFAADDELVAGTSALTSLISQAVSSAVLRATSNLHPPLPRSSSSDDDFEIISRDELNNS